MMRRMQRLMIAAVAVVVLGGCTGSNNSNESTGESTPIPQAKKAEPVDLTFFYACGADTQERFDLIYGDYIKKAYPHFNIKLLTTPTGKKVSDVLTLNPAIDVVYSGLSSMQDCLIEPGLAYDIEPLIKQHKYDISAIEPSFIDLIKQVGNGKLYGLPEYAGTVKLIYNKDLFDKFGVPYPKDGMTWDETYELAKKMTRQDGGIQYLGLNIIFNHYVRFNQLSVGFIDPKTDKALFASDNRWQQVVANAVRFNQLAGYEGNKFVAERTLFEKEKRLAMIVTGNAVDGVNWRDVNFDFAKLPTFSQLPGVGASGNPNFFTVSSISKHKDEAFQAIAYLTSKEYQLKNVRNGREPSVKDLSVKAAFGADEPVLKTKNIKGYFSDKLAAPMVLTKYDSIGLKYLEAEMKKLATSEITDVNTALRTAAESTDKEIATLKTGK